MRYLIIPDIHLKHKIVDAVLNAHEANVDKVIFLGDTFDGYGDNVQMNVDTAHWLKDSLTKPNRIHLIGNHDFGYLFPDNDATRCSGWTPEKCTAINEVMTREDWDKLKYFHYSPENDFYFAHGGFSNRLWNHPVLGFNRETVANRINKAHQQVLRNDWSDTRRGLPSEFGIGFSRGGWQPTGGITWCDFDREFDLIEGVNQIVGHTPSEVWRVKEGKDSINYGLDTGLRDVYILDGKKLEPIELDWWKGAGMSEV